MPSTRAIKRLVTYALFGTGTSLLDICILWILREQIGIYYLFAAALSFTFSATVSYLCVRRFVFNQTERPIKEGYVYFLMITGTGLGLTLGTMAILVEIFGLHYLIARIIAAVSVGLWNYLMNLYINFKVAGRY